MKDAHCGLTQNIRCQRTSGNADDDTHLQSTGCNATRTKDETIEFDRMFPIEEVWILKMELHSSDSVLEMVIKEEEQKAIDREIRLAYAVAHRVLPKARPRKGSSI